MTTNGRWMYQGRKEHGWFGTGTAPAEAADESAGMILAERTDYAAHSIVMHVPRAERSRWTNAASEAVRARLKVLVPAWAAASGLGREAFRSRFLGPYASDDIVDGVRHAARGIVEATDREALGKAGQALAAVAMRVGADDWSRFVADAAERLPKYDGVGSNAEILRLAGGLPWEEPSQPTKAA